MGFLWLCCALIAVASAQECGRSLSVASPQKLVPSVNIGDREFLGQYIKSDFPWLVAGGYGNERFRGRARVYKWEASSGRFEYKQDLLPTQRVNQGYFGLNLHICGDYIVVGHPYFPTAGTRSGAAEVYQRQGDTWEHFQTLSAFDAQRQAWYGYATGCSGNKIVIGARNQNLVDESGNLVQERVGAGYIYTLRGNPPTFQLDQVVRGTKRSIQLCDEIRICESTGPGVQERVICGAPRDGPATRGSVYIWARNRFNGVWEFQQNILIPRERAPGNMHHEGEGIYCEGNRLIFGGERAWNPLSDRGGNAHVYEYSSSSGEFEFVQNIEPNRGGVLRYGQRLHGRDNVVCVSAWTDPENGSGSGAVYCHIRCADSSWSLAAKLLAPGGSAEDNFGKTVHMDERYIYAGAPKEDSNGAVDRGAVYAFPYEVVVTDDGIGAGGLDPNTLVFSGGKPTTIEKCGTVPCRVRYNVEEDFYVRCTLRRPGVPGNTRSSRGSTITASSGRTTVQLPTPTRGTIGEPLLWRIELRRALNDRLIYRDSADVTLVECES